MAHDAMVTQALTKEMIDGGAALLKKLDADELGVTAAFWLYLENSEVWTLIIASPEVQSEGPKKMYGRIQQVLDSASAINLRDISVVPSDDPTVRLLRAAIGTGPADVSEIRFSRNTINGHFIEDAYIYRSA